VWRRLDLRLLIRRGECPSHVGAGDARCIEIESPPQEGGPSRVEGRLMGWLEL